MRNYLLIGERYIPFELYIENPSLTTIKEIFVRLVQYRVLDGHRAMVDIFQQALPEMHRHHCVSSDALR